MEPLSRRVTNVSGECQAKIYSRAIHKALGLQVPPQLKDTPVLVINLEPTYIYTANTLREGEKEYIVQDHIFSSSLPQDKIPELFGDIKYTELQRKLGHQKIIKELRKHQSINLIILIPGHYIAQQVRLVRKAGNEEKIESTIYDSFNRSPSQPLPASLVNIGNSTIGSAQHQVDQNCCLHAVFNATTDQDRKKQPGMCTTYFREKVMCHMALEYIEMNEPWSTESQAILDILLNESQLAGGNLGINNPNTFCYQLRSIISNTNMTQQDKRERIEKILQYTQSKERSRQIQIKELQQLAQPSQVSNREQINKELLEVLSRAIGALYDTYDISSLKNKAAELYATLAKRKKRQKLNETILGQELQRETLIQKQNEMLDIGKRSRQKIGEIIRVLAQPQQVVTDAIIAAIESCYNQQGVNLDVIQLSIGNTMGDSNISKRIISAIVNAITSYHGLSGQQQLAAEERLQTTPEQDGSSNVVSAPSAPRIEPPTQEPAQKSSSPQSAVILPPQKGNPLPQTAEAVDGEQTQNTYMILEGTDKSSDSYRQDFIANNKPVVESFTVGLFDSNGAAIRHLDKAVEESRSEMKTTQAVLKPQTIDDNQRLRRLLSAQAQMHTNHRKRFMEIVQDLLEIQEKKRQKEEITGLVRQYKLKLCRLACRVKAHVKLGTSTVELNGRELFDTMHQIHQEKKKGEIIEEQDRQFKEASSNFKQLCDYLHMTATKASLDKGVRKEIEAEQATDNSLSSRLSAAHDGLDSEMAGCQQHGEEGRGK